MEIRPEQISRVIRAQIKHYAAALEQSETGAVAMVGDGIARVVGLDKCMAGELVQFENGVTAMGQIGFDDIVNGMELVSTVDVVKEGVGQDQYGFVFVKP